MRHGRCRILVALLTMLFLAACNTPSPVKIDALPTPSQTTGEPVEGSFEVRLDTTMSRIRQQMKELGYGTVNDYKYFVIRDGTTWESMLAFYNKALGSEWVTDSKLSGREHDYGYAGWRRGTQTLVIEYLEVDKNLSILAMMLTD